MTRIPKRRRRACGGALALTLWAGAQLLTPAGAAAAPIVTDTWATQVFATSARLNAKVNPNGPFTTYHFDFIARAAYEANLAAGKDPFSGAGRVPAVGEANAGSGSNAVAVSQQPASLLPGTAYRYRIVAKSSVTTTGPTEDFVTQVIPSGADTCANAQARDQTGAKASEIADCRGYELVSPVDKNGGEVASPGSIAGGGVSQAALQGPAVTYSSEASFAGGQGAPPASQYLATRNSGGWSTENLTAPIFSGSYDAIGQGVPYQLFSADLARAIMLNGDHCRGEGEACAVANPPLAGTDAPAGYQNYYLREEGLFTALLGAANAGFLSLEPRDFDLRLAGASADLKRPVLSSCAAMSANATEVPQGEGCDETKQNLYLWSAGSGLSLINLLPAQATGTPGAQLAARSGAISETGSRAYFILEGDLYLREGTQTKQVDEDAGGGGEFQAASLDGSVAYFLKDEHLWRYVAAGDIATDIAPSGGVKGVLGASTNGQAVYFQDSSGLRRWGSSTTTTVASGPEAAEEGTWPPATGTSRVSQDGNKLLFVSEERLTGYDNTDLATGEPDSQVFLYDATGAGTLTCVSCNPTLGRPAGPSTIPGSIPNGTAPGSTDSYKPRALSANGRRVFFESGDAIAIPDTNGATDVYQWEAQGEGSCQRPEGCVSLVSTGRGQDGATFLDASADGADAFFLTAESLVKADIGARDLYDARAGGGFVEAPEPIACEGDACQPLVSAPRDPTLTTLLTGPGNPGVSFPKRKCPKGKVKRKGKCVKKRDAQRKARTNEQGRRGRSGR